MSIQSEISRISGNVADALTAIGNKGVSVPQGANSDDLADLIAAITSGGGGSSVQIATGTVSGSGTNTLQIPCDFAPDLIYVHGDMTGDASLRGCTLFLIIKDTYLQVCIDSSSSNTEEYIYGNDYSITGYSGNDASVPHGEYASGNVNLYIVTTSSSARFHSDVTYTYKFIKWT